MARIEIDYRSTRRIENAQQCSIPGYGRAIVDGNISDSIAYLEGVAKNSNQISPTEENGIGRGHGAASGDNPMDQSRDS